MNTLITDEIVDMIMRTKSRMPAGYKITTIENEAYLILHVDKDDFEKYSLTDRIRIAEGLNELCERVKTTGCPCYIQKT